MREQMPQMPVNLEEQPNHPEQLPQEKEQEKMLEELTGLVGEIYVGRLEKKREAQKATDGEIASSLKDNLDHIGQVKDNVDFIIKEIKAGRMTEDSIFKNENGQVTLKDKLLRAMAVLHDIAKIDEKGELDTFYHHEKNKVEKIIFDDKSGVAEFLKKNGFDSADIEFIINGIERHSQRTDFIARYFKQREKEADLPGPEGVLEYEILSDADILTQSRLDQGVKKIICSRLMNDFFRQNDTIDGCHSFAKSLESVVDSAQKVSEAMHFDLTRQKALNQLTQVLDFENWLKQNNKITEIDSIESFDLKKKKFDELIGEFLGIADKK